ncbi:MAG: ATP-binding cassette domain-containing protein [Clostridia bacterium]|nr:ATP-binding cassette domain-containing protein [Clostridia bacterium]
MQIIEVQKLSKEFKGVKAVNEVSFDVAQGEIFGFLGPNGAGKSTTIKMLCTLQKPSSGRAILNGFDVVKEAREVRKSIGLVFQDPSLDDNLTAEENLDFHGRIYGVEGKARRARIDEVLELIELSDRKKNLVKTFSGGMKRRLEIGRGFLHYPKVLFLDEPTVGLDPQTRNAIWEYIHQLKVKEKLTIFLTTHYMDEAENCDRIAIIDKGEIVALATPAELKETLGGDVVRLVTVNNQLAKKELVTKLGIFAQEELGGLVFQVTEGEQFIPRLFKELDSEILTVTLAKPTLDDVFLKITGREIRSDEGAESTTALIQRRRGRRG